VWKNNSNVNCKEGEGEEKEVREQASKNKNTHTEHGKRQNDRETGQQSRPEWWPVTWEKK
jgi:hypothetical protein